MPIPLQVPGGPELLVIGLIMVVLLAIPVGVLGVVVYLDRRGSETAVPGHQRIDELEERVEVLEEKLNRTGESEASDDPTTE